MKLSDYLANELILLGDHYEGSDVADAEPCVGITFVIGGFTTHGGLNQEGLEKFFDKKIEEFLKKKIHLVQVDG